ncbi:MAG TPA: hypothetical protein VJV77_03550 [Casimicrobiaceae bacterium]|nr:hypothetical protein [Casimicrobiaceae bacterium]
MRNRIGLPQCAERASIAAGDAWWRQPVLWLGAAILLVSLAGCIVMLMLAARHADAPLPTAGVEILRVPVAHPAPGADPAIEPSR